MKKASALRYLWRLPILCFVVPDASAWGQGGLLGNKNESPLVVDRRGFLHTIPIATMVVFPKQSNAANPMDAGEAIRRGAANIPGYGQTDVFFPEAWAGTWKISREVEFGGRKPLQLDYNFRFIRSIEDGAVVADRGVNQAELEKALIRTVTGDNDTVGVRSFEWSVTNPNDLRLVLLDGSKKEIKVTKRATERTENTATSSEFQRITQEDERGIPVISARRVITKWRSVDDTTIEGIEVVYAMAGGDPLSTGLGGSQNSGNVLSKSRILLTRSST